MCEGVMCEGVRKREGEEVSSVSVSVRVCACACVCVLACVREYTCNEVRQYVRV